MPTQNLAPGQLGQPPGLASNPFLVSRQSLHSNAAANAYAAAAMRSLLLQPMSNLNSLQALQARVLLGGSSSEFGASSLAPHQQQEQLPLIMAASQGTSSTSGSHHVQGHSLTGHLAALNAMPTQVNAAALQPGTIPDRTSLAVASMPSSSSTALPTSITTTVAATTTSLEPDRDMKLLYTPADDTKLSPYQCKASKCRHFLWGFIATNTHAMSLPHTGLARKQIELYEASDKDLEAGAQGRNRPIVLGQVGKLLSGDSFSGHLH